MNLFSEGSFYRPAICDPLFYCRIAHSQYFAPFDHGPFFSSEFQPSILPRIPVLKFLWYPPAILFGVPLVDIDPIQSHPDWPLTHVSQETLEIRSPSIANLNSSSTISMIVGRFWVVTSSFHEVPCIVGRGISDSTGVPMSIKRVFFTSLRHIHSV